MNHLKMKEILGHIVNPKPLTKKIKFLGSLTCLAFCEITKKKRKKTNVLQLIPHITQLKKLGICLFLKDCLLFGMNGGNLNLLEKKSIDFLIHARTLNETHIM